MNLIRYETLLLRDGGVVVAVCLTVIAHGLQFADVKDHWWNLVGLPQTGCQTRFKNKEYRRLC